MPLRGRALRGILRSPFLGYDREMVSIRIPAGPAILSLVLSLVLSGALGGARPAVAQGTGAAPRKTTATAAGVDADRLAATTASLASKEYEGRLAGSPGYDRAAAMAAATFKSLRYTPAWSSGYLQRLEVEYDEIRRCELAAANEEGSLLSLQHGPDFTCRGLTEPGAFAAPVVFAGYGISRPDLGWDDYEGLDAKGKVVLVFKDAPTWSPEKGSWGEAVLPRPRARAAKAHGALALLMVGVPKGEKVPMPIGSLLEGPPPQPGIPSLEVSPEVADRLLSPAGATVVQLWKEYEEKKKPSPRPAGRAVSGFVEATYSPARPTANVVAVLRGAEAETREEWILVGAHLDHVGTQAGLLFPGANDNASGAAAVLEVAAALHRVRFQPERTIVFVLFSAEEGGLLGAKAFAAAPPAPLGKMVAMLNLDSIGAGESLQLGGGKSAPKLFDLVRSLDLAGDRVTVADTWAGGGADAEPFFEKGVPTLYFAATKGYGHLHLPTDTPATLNRRLHSATANLALRTILALGMQGRYEREGVLPREAAKPGTN